MFPVLYSLNEPVYFLGFFYPDPYGPMQIRIQEAYLYADPCGSGFETLCCITYPTAQVLRVWSGPARERPGGAEAGRPAAGLLSPPRGRSRRGQQQVLHEDRFPHHILGYPQGRAIQLLKASVLYRRQRFFLNSFSWCLLSLKYF